MFLCLSARNKKLKHAKHSQTLRSFCRAHDKSAITSIYKSTQIIAYDWVLGNWWILRTGSTKLVPENRHKLCHGMTIFSWFELIFKLKKAKFLYILHNFVVVVTEDVDPSIGRFRNLVSVSIIPMKVSSETNYLPNRPNIKFLFSGATFHIPLTKSATLNRLLHCSLWQFSGALFWFSRALFCNTGAKSPEAPM